jgi:hypothetical protein
LHTNNSELLPNCSRVSEGTSSAAEVMGMLDPEGDAAVVKGTGEGAGLK